MYRQASGPGTDTRPVSYTHLSQTLDAKNKLMSNTGIMQHPNTECMSPNEYDELIADPYAFLIDKCVPRLYKNLNVEESRGRALFALYQEMLLEGDYYAKTGAMVQRLNEKYGYPDDAGIQGFCRAPMDWIGDQLRSFSGICMDIRRHRKDLIRALDAIYPVSYTHLDVYKRQDIDSGVTDHLCDAGKMSFFVFNKNG